MTFGFEFSVERFACCVVVLIVLLLLGYLYVDVVVYCDLLLCYDCLL